MPGSTLKISSAAIALIKKNQGLSLEKYRDINGMWVIGYGHVIHPREDFRRLITPHRGRIFAPRRFAIMRGAAAEKCDVPLNPTAA